jgi:methyltransferase (TIGR00027 family)
MLEASQTMRGAAMLRAAHLLFDEAPHVFADPFAYPLIGPGADTVLDGMIARRSPAAFARMRAQAVSQFRHNEEELEVALGRGATQYVLLGAGLDSFAWRRSDLLPAIGVFEVDQPNSQQFKRDRLSALHLRVPDGVHLVEVDFEREDFMGRLIAAGFDRSLSTFVQWIGVTAYLSLAAIEQTVSILANLGPVTAACVGYVLSAKDLDDALDREIAEQNEARAAALGEPLEAFFTPEHVEELALRCGFDTVRHFGPGEASAYFAGRSDGLDPGGWGRLVTMEKA